MCENKMPRIRILANGPYIVTGNIPLFELIIESKGGGYIYRQGRVFPSQDQYSLCRCGKSGHMPFCDGTHLKRNFHGVETASRKPYIEQSDKLEGPDLDLTDCENLCAFARFCHSDEGDVWELTRKSDDLSLKEVAIKAAKECPSGRLVAWDKATGKAFEPKFQPSIAIIQDPERDCSGPIWVRGPIQIEAADGYEYEMRNRVTLCRCGESHNKPFCDATHVSCKFKDWL